MKNITTMQNLRSQAISDNAEGVTDRIEKIESEIFNNEISWYAKQFLTDLRIKQFKAGKIDSKQLFEIAKKKVIKVSEKEIDIILNKINAVEESINLKEHKDETITITVEWTKNRTWGNCPKATLTDSKNRYFSNTITGCGYDKESTAVASVLNEYLPILRLMYQEKNNNITIPNHELLGYGGGYGLLPYFEGGVGVNCFRNIFEKLGYKFTNISSGKNFDVYTITKM